MSIENPTGTLLIAPHSGVCNKPPFANTPVTIFDSSSLAPGLGTS